MAGSGDVLGIATSGLIAYQRALATAGHNVSNASTPGYSRQRVEMGTQTPQQFGSGFVGSGVTVDTVRRNYDGFLVEQVRTSMSATRSMETYYGEASRLSNLLGDDQSALTGGLDRFFNAMQALANDPGSTTARQVLLGEADALAGRFNYLDGQMDDIRAGVNTRVRNIVGDINSLAEGIADINRSIVKATGQAGGQPPNDLLDRRDLMLEQLSELVSVKAVAQDDGSINVSIGKGQALVTGFEAAQLSTATNEFDATRLDVTYAAGNGAAPVPVTTSLSGGRLGGLLAFRDEVLDPQQSALGRIAVGLATEVNAQHALGMDLDGDLGGAFFKDLTTAPAVPSRNNSGDYEIDATITDPAQLRASDYRLDYDGSNYTLTRLSDSTVVGTYGSLPIDVTTSEGFSLSLASGTSISAGDRFLVRPTQAGGGLFDTAVSDVRDIAAASPVRVREETDAQGVPTNGGTGAIGNLSVDDASGLPLSGMGVRLTYLAGSNQFVYVGSYTGTLSYDPATDSGSTYTIGGMSFTVSGNPANSDVFYLEDNANGAGDNRNALAMAGLREGLTLDGGSASFNNAYGQMVAETGAKTRQAEITRDAQQTLLQNAIDARSSTSGVNLDEEAADMLKFQQAYQASAKVVSVADSMFQTLLTALGR